MYHSYIKDEQSDEPLEKDDSFLITRNKRVDADYMMHNKNFDDKTLHTLNVELPPPAYDTLNDVNEAEKSNQDGGIDKKTILGS